MLIKIYLLIGLAFFIWAIIKDRKYIDLKKQEKCKLIDNDRFILLMMFIAFVGFWPFIIMVGMIEELER